MLRFSSACERRSASSPVLSGELSSTTIISEDKDGGIFSLIDSSKRRMFSDSLYVGIMTERSMRLLSETNFPLWFGCKLWIPEHQNALLTLIRIRIEQFLLLPLTSYICGLSQRRIRNLHASTTSM